MNFFIGPETWQTRWIYEQKGEFFSVSLTEVIDGEFKCFEDKFIHICFMW